MKTRILISLLAMCLWIAGCAIPSATSVPTVAATTPSPQSDPSDTFQPVNTPLTMTAIMTKTPKGKPTVTPSPSPRPMLSVYEAKTLILHLVQKHEGCRLPCLWGFIPGKSKLETARAFVKQFGLGDFKVDDIELGGQDYGDMGGVYISYPKNDIYISIDFAYYKGEDTSDLDLLSMGVFPLVNLGIDPINNLPIYAPTYGDSTFNQELHDYLISSILSTYGQPSQVLLEVGYDEPGRPDIKSYPFSVALMYPEKGIYVEYESLREIRGSNYLGCPNKSRISVGVWDPQANLPLKYIMEKAGVLRSSKLLEEATSLTMDEFYQIFSNSESSSCLETPIEMWPGP